MKGPPLPIVVFGAVTCEDTAITESRLRAAGVPFEAIDIDRSAEALDRVRGLNGGRRVTPTVVFGDDEHTIAEPSLERLGALVQAAGHAYEAPAVTEVHGEVTGRAIPLRTVRGHDGTSFGISTLRGRRQVALFLGHGPGCLACFGYARQLALRESELGEADGVPVIVVSGSHGAEHWREDIPSTVAVVGDADGTWKRAIGAALKLPADDPILLLVDRFLAPRAVSTSAEAGGLVDPSDAVAWLRFLALECPECSGEIEWPAVTPG